MWNPLLYHGQNMKWKLNVSLIPCRRLVKRQTFNWNIQPVDICLYCLWSFYHQYFPKNVKEQIQLTAGHLIMMKATVA
ncbi:hypothetical protein NQ317_019467 [Molorchus minor]|uniref:Uncharacterized protein n=1 Tax=Molorchus minor TaxID=1323400 RepID=A0ABQ9JRD2_9CUCU|nr:hypothetical protein NQ317_019467 [Molorchus minor]